MGTNYIPPTDAGLNAWAQNFSALITADPTSYGLVAGDATAIAGVATTYNTALGLATDPSTRTPATIAAKDTAASALIAVVRPYAMQINLNQAVTNDQRVALGITVRATTRTAVPPPSVSPTLALDGAVHGVMNLRYYNGDTPTSKSKPAGAIGMQLATFIGTTAITDPTLAKIGDILTKSPFMQLFDNGDMGKYATFFGRYTTRSGPAGIAQYGPWSAPLTVVIV